MCDRHEYRCGVATPAFALLRNTVPLQGLPMSSRHRSFATVAAFLIGYAGSVLADPFPPEYGPVDEANGPVHFAPVAWPVDAPTPAQCGHTCGDWQPYDRFQNSVADPRIQDPSNGGTAPQNYVNVSSSCIDRSYPSIYYKLHQGLAPDGSQDVIMFRWRVEQIANNYATGPNAGSFGATDPWSSGLWTVLFDIDGDGYRDLAAHLNGSSGSPSEPIDLIAGIWGTIPTQSIDYVTDPSIRLIAHNPTAFSSGSQLLNFQNAVNPTTNWGAAPRTVWDHGTTRSTLVSTNACNEYFIDYQIPVRMLDASSTGPNPALNGPKIGRSTPISMLFCTANSLNNPFQKDCAINNTWAANPSQPAPFGDYLSFDQSQPYAQPIISTVTAQAPATCPGSYQLTATVQDTLALQQGVVVPSVADVDFFYWFDANQNGDPDEAGGEWTRITPTAQLQAGSLNRWQVAWNATGLPRGAYLVGVQAVDDRLMVDQDMVPAARDHRSFSYAVGDATAAIYLNDAGGWSSAAVQSGFPVHSPDQQPVNTEDWYGNPDVVGQQIAVIDVAINTCGELPELSKTASPDNVGTSEPVTFQLVLQNTTSSPISVTQLSDTLPTGFQFQSTDSLTLDAVPVVPDGAPSVGASGTLVWTFSSLTLAPGQALSLNLTALAGALPGRYNNIASALTNAGQIDSPPAAVGVDAARLSFNKVPDRYLVEPDGSTALIYTLGYSNDSAVQVTNAQIVDPLPADTQFVGCTGGASCAFSSGSVTWQLGTLLPGQSGTVELRLTVNTNYPSSSLQNTASLSALAPGNVPVNRTATATVAVNVPVPAFTLDKVGSAVQVAPGSNYTWTISYQNFGSGSASGVVLTDALPDGFSFVSCDVAGSHFSSCAHADGNLTFGPAVIPAGGSGSVSISVLVAPAPFSYANPARNEAQINWTGALSPVDATADVGVTGQSCRLINYLHQGNLLDSQAPPVAQAGVKLDLYGANTAVFTTAPFASALPLADRVLSLKAFIDAKTASADLDILVERILVGGAVQAITTFNANPPTAPQIYQFVTPAFASNTADLAAGERLRLTFVGTGNNISNRIELFFDGTQVFNGSSTYTDSLTSVCSTVGAAALSLNKQVDEPHLLAAPATLAYTLAFANIGGVATAGAQIVDVLPANTSLVSAELNGVPVVPSVSGQTVTMDVNSAGQAAGVVAAGASGTVVLHIAVDASASGTLINHATASASGVTPVSDSASTVIGSFSSGGSPALSLSKSVDVTSIGAGDVVTYRLTVVNTGNGDATNVSVTDDFPEQAYFQYLDCTVTAPDTCGESPAGTLAWTVGTLSPGEARQLSFRMQAASSGLPAGVTLFDNQATASDDDYCTAVSVPGCESEQVTVSMSAAPELQIIKTVSPASNVTPGDVLTYTLAVQNVGASMAEQVRVLDAIPDYTGFAGGLTTSQGAAAFDALSNRVIAELGNLAAGASATIEFDVRVLAVMPQGTTNVTNIATATAANAAGVADTAQNAVAAQPTLWLEKSGPATHAMPSAHLAVVANATTTLFVDDPSRLLIGAPIRLNGGIARITAIIGQAVSLDAPLTGSVGDTVQMGYTYVLTYGNAGDAIAGNVNLTDALPAAIGFVAARPTPDSAPAPGASGTVLFNLGQLAPQQSGTVEIDVVPLSAGTYINQATLAAAGVPAAIDQAVTRAGGLRVDKSTSTPYRRTGELAAYQLRVENTGATNALGVQVTDLLPPGFSYDSTIAMQINGSAVVPAQVPVVGDAFPSWGLFTVPAGQTLIIDFLALVGADTGPATYDNELDVTSSNTGVQDFDHLATVREDVTVLADDQGVVEGVVYRDIDGNGSFDALTDIPIPAAEILVSDSNGVVYVAIADASGAFRRVVPAGSTWVAVTDNSLPSGLIPTVGIDGTNPNVVIVPAGGSARDDNGYVQASGAIGAVVGRVFDDTTSENGSQDLGEPGRLGILVELRDAITGVVVRSTFTDQLGDYAFLSVPTGDYVVHVAAPSGRAFSPFTTNNRAVSVPDGGTVRADFGLIVAVTVDADLVVTKDNGTAQVTSGGTTTYSLVISNAGPNAADGALIHDAGVPGLSKLSVSCSLASGGATCPGAPSVTALENGTLSIPLFPSGGSITLEIAADVTAAAGDSVANSASIAPPDGVTDPDPANNSDIDTDDVVAPPLPLLSLDKQALLVDSVIANGSADTGETINYTLTARNDGNVGLSGVVISDPRLPLLTCTPSQPANLAPTQTLVCSGSYVVQQADLDAGVAISNTATADSDQTAAVQDTATVPVTAATSIGVAKTLVTQSGSGVGPYTLVYRLRIANYGSVGLSNVTLSDDLAQTFPAPTAFTVTSVVVETGNLVLDPAFDGRTHTQVISGGQLNVGAIADVRLEVRVSPNGVSGPFFNVATTSAIGDGTLTPVSDISDNNVSPDANGDGIPDESSPTPVSFSLLAPPNVIPSLGALGLWLLAGLLTMTGLWFGRRAFD